VRASTLDAYWDELRPHAASLPEVGDEIGDTWIHGVGTDPHKVRRLRALLRWRSAALAATPSLAGRPDMRRFSTLLLQMVEHTWGCDMKDRTGLLNVPWETPTFLAERAAGSYDRAEYAWREQRAYVDQALAALAGSSLHEAALAALAMDDSGTEGRVPDWTTVAAEGGALTLGACTVAVDPATGALARCDHAGRGWATRERPLGLLRYQVYGGNDYERYFTSYNPDPNEANARLWFYGDFAKPGLERVLAEGCTFAPRLVRLEQRAGAVRATCAFADEAQTRFGCPRRVTLTWTAQGSGLRLTVRWSGKQASRIPEALWLGFHPQLDDAEGWRMQILGRAIDPRRVVSKGARALHAVEEVSGRDARGGCTLTPLDSALIAPGRPRLVEFADAVADPNGEGLWANLHNTAWGTNYPMWYDEDAVLRFDLAFAGAGQ
jgi:hypothetical protein